MSGVKTASFQDSRPKQSAETQKAAELGKAYYSELKSNGYDQKLIINVCIAMLDCIMNKKEDIPNQQPQRETTT